MIEVKTGNLLDSDAQTLVNTVNCVGIMGKGIALQFKKQFPQMFADYEVRCRRNEVLLGEPYIFRQLVGPNIVNFPTKDHWRSLARLSDIIAGLNYLQAHYKEWGVTSIAVPPLGCGNGQLEWKVVGRTLYRHLKRLDIDVELYAPEGTPSSELQSSYLEADALRPLELADNSWIKPSWVAIVEIVKRLDEQPYHWPIGRIVFQKILYVATRLGIPTGLDFAKASYGPFSKGAKQLESRLMNNGLINVDVIRNRHQYSVGRTYQDARRSYLVELSRWEGEIERVVDLFARISTANQAELVATVLFAADEVGQRFDIITEKNVFDEVITWKLRRNPPLDPFAIGETIRVLASQDWLHVQYSDELPVDDWSLIHS